MGLFSWFRRKSFSNNAADAVVDESNGNNEFYKHIPKYKGVAPKDRYDQIEFAFQSGGVNYFRFSTEVNIPFQRAVAARDILTEELWQINPAVLKAWSESAIAVLTKPNTAPDKKVYEVAILVNRLKEQMELSQSLTRQLKLATVIYFDEHENPLDYQYPYNKKKLEHWMAHNDVAGFFLNLPEYLLMPSIEELMPNFQNYLLSETTEMINNLTHIISAMPSDKASNDLKKDLHGQMATYKDMRTWSQGRFTNTM